MKAETTHPKITKNKSAALLLLLMGLLGIAIVIYRIAAYQYEYNAESAPVDYGRFNVLSYFTIQSNLCACLYFITIALAVFGIRKAQKIAFSPTVGALITLYVFVAGATYNAGFPLKMTPALTFDTPYHIFISCMQLYFHVIMVITVLWLWLFPFRNEKLTGKTVLLSGIYPLVYSLFSIVRGALFLPAYYPYPFYKPEFVWALFMKDKPMNLAGAYVFMALLLVFGIGLFMVLCTILVVIHNKRIQK